MQQLDYWFSKSGGKPFYKFTNAPEQQNPFYKEGDSWCEELSFSVDEFRTAFGHIGIKYNSKKEFQAAIDSEVGLFQNKFYAAYTDKMKYITYYHRNNELVDYILNCLINGEYQSTEIAIANLRKQAKSIYVNGESQSTYMGKVNPELNTDTNTDTTTNNTSNKKREQAPPSLQNENSFFSENEEKEEVEVNANFDSHYSTDSKINEEAKFDVATLILELVEKVATEAEAYYLACFKTSKPRNKQSIDKHYIKHESSSYALFCAQKFRDMCEKQGINPQSIYQVNFEGENNQKKWFGNESSKKGSFNVENIPAVPLSMIEKFKDVSNKENENEIVESINDWAQLKITGKTTKKRVSRFTILAEIFACGKYSFEFMSYHRFAQNACEKDYLTLFFADTDEKYKQFQQPKQNKQFQQSNQDTPQYSDRDKAEIAAMFRYYEQGKQRDVEDMVIMLGYRGIDGAQLIREKYGIGQS
jgi:hypothetical protein